jgi:lipoprotein-anchoring transpeptidase ErfK/SrfK
MLRYFIVFCGFILGSQVAFAHSPAQLSSTLTQSSAQAVDITQQQQLARLTREQRQARRLKRRQERQLKRQQRRQAHSQENNYHRNRQVVKQRRTTPAKPKRAPFVNKFPQTRIATGERVFIFDPKLTQWGAYDAEGNLVKSGRASGGRSYCPDIKSKCRTPAGEYAVYRRGSASCKSKKFPVGRGGAPMPYCTFFNGGYAIHGSYSVPDYNASHGCIRVEPHMAKWLSENFLFYGTRVIVKSY